MTWKYLFVWPDSDLDARSLIYPSEVGNGWWAFLVLRRWIIFLWLSTMVIWAVVDGGYYYLQFTQWSLFISAIAFLFLAILGTRMYMSDMIWNHQGEFIPVHVEWNWFSRLTQVLVSMSIPFEIVLSMLYWGFGLYAFDEENEVGKLGSITDHAIIAGMWVLELVFSRIELILRHVWIVMTVLVIYSAIHALHLFNGESYIYKPIQLEFGVLRNVGIFFGVFIMILLMYIVLYRIVRLCHNRTVDRQDREAHKQTITVLSRPTTNANSFRSSNSFTLFRLYK